MYLMGGRGGAWVSNGVRNIRKQGYIGGAVNRQFILSTRIDGVSVHFIYAFFFFPP